MELSPQLQLALCNWYWNLAKMTRQRVCRKCNRSTWSHYPYRNDFQQFQSQPRIHFHDKSLRMFSHGRFRHWRSLQYMGCLAWVYLLVHDNHEQCEQVALPLVTSQLLLLLDKHHRYHRFEIQHWLVCPSSWDHRTRHCYRNGLELPDMCNIFQIDSKLHYSMCILSCKIFWTVPLIIWIIKLWSIMFSIAKFFVTKLFANSQIISIRTSVEIVLNVTVWWLDNKWWTTFEDLFNLIAVLVFMKIWSNRTTMICVSKMNGQTVKSRRWVSLLVHCLCNIGQGFHRAIFC